MAAFATADFTGTNGQSIQTPDTNWVKVGTGANLNINTNRAIAASANSVSIYYNNGGTPAGADYEVQADFTASAEATSPATCIRVNTSSGACYFVRYSGAWELYKYTGGGDGGVAAMGTPSSTNLLNDTTRTVILRISGGATTTVKVIVSGTEVLSVDDSSSPITAAGRAGAGSYYADTGADRSIDIWSATDTAAAAAHYTVTELTISSTVG